MSRTGFLNGGPFVQGSHASPSPSWSESSWSGLGTVGQLSTASHTPSPSPSGRCTSAGQSLLEPSHDSATSQEFATPRQTVLVSATPSGGQAAERPSQV